MGNVIGDEVGGQSQGKRDAGVGDGCGDDGAD